MCDPNHHKRRVCDVDGSPLTQDARILLNTLLNVTLLSILLTIIGTWVGTKQISLEPFQHFFQTWFRNFGVAFWIELIVAQPIARAVMKKLHARQRMLSHK